MQVFYEAVSSFYKAVFYKLCVLHLFWALTLGVVVKSLYELELTTLYMESWFANTTVNLLNTLKLSNPVFEAICLISWREKGSGTMSCTASRISPFFFFFLALSEEFSQSTVWFTAMVRYPSENKWYHVDIYFFKLKLICLIKQLKVRCTIDLYMVKVSLYKTVFSRF